jgi:hypothetical protein
VKSASIIVPSGSGSTTINQAFGYDGSEFGGKRRPLEPALVDALEGIGVA